MANKQSVEIHGIKDMIKRLEALPVKLKKSGEKAALRAGGAPIRKAAKRFAKSSKDSGLLLKSIGMNVRTIKSGETSARIGARNGFGKEVTRTNKKTGQQRKEYANPANYSHLVEFGTSHSPAKPFIRPAIDSAKSEILPAMAAGLSKHLARAASK
jgi:HK97 gp10 family phage protein